MTFDEWYETAEVNNSTKENMRLAWNAALASQNTDTPRAGDVWRVKVKGGQIESQVVINSADSMYVWISDVYQRDRVIKLQRQHRLEDLEFISLIKR